MLTFIKTVHTIVWALFVACIFGIFGFVYVGQLGAALVLIAIVMGEAVVLALNGMRCPLTIVAERYTDDRAYNFDIYIPRWLAQEQQDDLRHAVRDRRWVHARSVVAVEAAGARG